MLSTNRTKSKLIAQGADAAHLAVVVEALQAANMLPADNAAPITAKECAALLVGSTAVDPAKAAEHVLIYGGLQSELGLFGLTMQFMLETQPQNFPVTAVRICQTFPLARVEYFDGDVQEHCSNSFIGRGFRQETVLSGGLLCDLAMALRFDTKAGWSEDPK